MSNITLGQYKVWKKDPVTKAFLAKLDEMGKAEMMAWAARNFKADEAHKTIEQENQSSGRIEAYSRIANSIINNNVVQVMKEEEDD